MKNTWSAWRYLWKSEDIRRMLLMTLLLLVIYRFAANVPTPGINPAALAAIQKNLATSGGNFFGFLDLLSGGTVSRFSLLSMAIASGAGYCAGLGFAGASLAARAVGKLLGVLIVHSP